MLKDTYLIIDFDSTFVTVESLDLLADIALKGNPRRGKIVSKIQEITRKGMEGEIPFEESLSSRLKLFKINRSNIQSLIRLLKKKVTPSVLRNKEFLKQYKDRIYIISGGFVEWVSPVAQSFGIDSSHVLANTFVFNNRGVVVDYDRTNPLGASNGKTQRIKKLNLSGKVYLIGDGHTDLEVKKSGAVDAFVAFTENVYRKNIVKQADYSVPNFDEFLYRLNLPRALSYPKNRMKVLLLESIDDSAADHFRQEGYFVESISRSLSQQDLVHKISDISILGIRSKSSIDLALLNNAKKLLTIGAFSVGTDQIDLATCARNGVVVFNAPFSNTRSVVELVLGEIIMLLRRIFDKSTKLHQGIWDKTSIGSNEVRGKKLGIIGYGHIGSQLSVLAEDLGMEVYYYDIAEKLPLGNAKKCSSLEEILRKVDIVTVHVDGRLTNKNVISEKEFSIMRDGVIFLNLSRGFVVNIESLAKYIKNGKVRGASVDVFSHEPKNNSEPFRSLLQGLPNVILTPHIGGSTEEAQKNIAEFVSEKLSNFINSGNTMLSVNFPNLQLPRLGDAHRVIHIHKNVPGVLAKMNNIFADEKINVEGQYLGTNQQIGYVITDVNKRYNKRVVDRLKKMPETIRLRVLY